MIDINNSMPTNKSTKQLGDAYLDIFNKTVPVNESVQYEDNKENLKRNYYSNTPFHKFQTDYGVMYESYRVPVILRESWNRDVQTVVYLMQQNEELCNEIFGAVGQKVKQGVQAGIQAVQQKLLQPLLQAIITKLPKNKQEELAKAAAGGPQALQQFIQAEGDPKVSQELASAPVNESYDANVLAIVEILTILSENSNVINEDTAQNKFNAFKKMLSKFASETKDPAIQQQIQQLSTYINQNYSTRGKLKQPQSQVQTQAQPTPVQQPATVQPGILAPTTPGVLPPAGPLPAGSTSVLPPGTAIPANAKTLPPSGSASGGLVSKALNWMKNNKGLTAAGAIGLLGAIGLATGGIGLPALTPALMGALKSAGVSGAIGAAGGAIKGAQQGGLKGAAQGALKGGAAGAAVGAAGSLVGQALGNAANLGGEQEVDGSALPKPEAPVSVSPQDVESQYKAAGLTTPPEVTPTEPLGPEEVAGPPEAPQQPTQQSTPAQQPTAGKGAEQLQNLSNKGQAELAAKNLQPGEKLVKDTLGRTFRVKR